MAGGFTGWWQTLPSRIDPFIIEIGSFRVGWYGMMYVAAYMAFYLYSRYRIRHEGLGGNLYTDEILQDFLLWSAFGLIIGARLGYVFFYNFSYYIGHPLEIILPIDPATGRYTGISGMSYHGGLLGSIFAALVFFRRHGLSFLRFIDDFIVGIPLGYIFGRLGNFINGELYGRATDVPWGMFFPSDPEHVLRHPSQLYEAFLEGVVLFVILWALRNRKFAQGLRFPIYLIGYGSVRFIVEFFRQPDAQLGFVLWSFSLGQILCFAMVIGGLALGVYQKTVLKAFWDSGLGEAKPKSG